MSRQQFSARNNIGKVFTFQKSGSTSSFDPTVNFSSGSRRVSWRINNGSETTQIAGNNITYTGFTSDSNLRNIELRSNSFKNIFELTMNNDNLYGFIDLSEFDESSFAGGTINLSSNAGITGITNPQISSSATSMSNYNLNNCNLIGNLDMMPISGNISSFLAHTNSNLTSITFSNTTNITGQFAAYNCNLIGNFDISMINVTNFFNVNSNSSLTQITHNPIGSNIATYQAANCNLTGLHDMSMISGLSFCWLWGNSNLTGITHTYSNSNFTQYWVSSCNLIGNHNLSMFPNLGGYFNISANNNLTGITHTASTRTFNNYIAGPGLVGNLDLSMLSGLGGRIEINSNTNLTGISFPVSSSQPINGLEIKSCNINGTLDLTGFSYLGSASSAITYPFQFQSNLNLSNILFPNGGGYLKNQGNNAINAVMGMYSCNLGYVDFKPLSGCTFISGVTEGIPRFELYNNSMTTADVNHILSDFDLISNLNYSGWTSTSGTSSGYIDISLNSAPDGSSGGYNGTGATINLISKGWTIITD